MAGNAGDTATCDATTTAATSIGSETTQMRKAKLADKDQEAVEQITIPETAGPIISEACKKLDEEADEEARRWEAIGEEGMEVLQGNQVRKWYAEIKGQQSLPKSRWDRLSAEEKLRKKRGWQHRKQILDYFEIQPYSTPPRAGPDASLGNDNAAEDQEVLDDLEHEEQEEVEQGAMKQAEAGRGDGDQGEVKAGAGTAREETSPYGGEERPVTYFTPEAEYYEQLEEASNVHPEDPDEDQKYWSSDEEAVNEWTRLSQRCGGDWFKDPDPVVDGSPDQDVGDTDSP